MVRRPRSGEAIPGHLDALPEDEVDANLGGAFFDDGMELRVEAIQQLISGMDQCYAFLRIKFLRVEREF
jgi:hypothetical protein